MHAGVKIQKNDTVYVIAGKERGKSGRVLRVWRENRRVLVEGLHMIKKAVKANPSKNIKGGIVERETTVHLSNLAVVCPECNSPTRVGRRKLQDGSKVRVCRKCDGVIDKA